MANFDSENSKTAERNHSVIYCDENFIICDMNDAALKRGFSKYRNKSMEPHISERDARVLHSMMECRKSGADRPFYSIVQIERIRGALYAYVSLTEYIKKHYFFFHIFQSRTDMLKNFDISKMMITEQPFSPVYRLNRNRVDMELTARDINRVLASNFLMNIYYTALDSCGSPEMIDVVELVRRMILDVSIRLEMNPSKYTFEYNERDSFAYPMISTPNFINTLALLIILAGKISSSKNVRVRVNSEKERAEILFVTDIPTTEYDVSRGVCFDVIGVMFPEYDAYVSAIKFICELHGIGCCALLEGEGHLTLGLVLAEAPPDIEARFMHNVSDECCRDYDELVEGALRLAKILDGIFENQASSDGVG